MIQEWLERNLISFEIKNYEDREIFFISNESFLEIFPKEGLLFDEDFDLLLSDQDKEIIISQDIKYLTFFFGNKYYYTLTGELTLNTLKYIGNANLSIEEDIPFLGVHGGYEIFNGTRNYSDWCKKAKFLGIKTLGICEHHTLAGVLNFQDSCIKNNIDPVIGETITVRFNGNHYTVKLYCKDQEGWTNLLNIHAFVKVHNETEFIDESELLSRSKGLICVLTEITDQLSIQRLIKTFKGDLYFQFNPSQWKSEERDKRTIEQFQFYYDHYRKKIKSVLISDAYYLDKEDAPIKHILNSTGNAGYQYQSDDLFFKDQDYLYNQILELTEETEEQESKAVDFIDSTILNNKEIAEKCRFMIETKTFKLPQYPLTEEEQKNFKNEEELFVALIQEGYATKVHGQVEDSDLYRTRIQEEIEVIKEGGFISYFLIIRDIIAWCDSQNILTGTGRGSVGGSLIAYLLGITKINPIEYGLLFERFLNKGRIKTSLPDIDTDITDIERDKVKQYIETRYGKNNVASIGTYPTLKIKAVIKELSRFYNIPPQTASYYTAMIPDSASIEEFFKEASLNPKLKEFVNNYPELINNIELCFEQPKNSSIHAAGLIITPRNINGKEVTIFDLMPVKKVNDMIITEWEGEYTEKAGFLKADFLGLKQLGKFSEILKLIKKDTGEDINLQSIDLADKATFQFFQQGYNEDVFQFGAPGLKAYCTELTPETIEDLIAVIALYRPGPIEIRAHLDYIKVKKGELQPSYDFMCYDITKDTNSLLIYQEQIMKVCQVVGGFSLVEADDIRKAMGKSKMDVMLSYKTRFIEGAVKQKCNKQEAERIWEKMVGFANYCFNKSHSVAYALTGYQSQWLKVHYPLQFWTISLRQSDTKQIPYRIYEIKNTGDINVLPPDINKSEELFSYDTQTMSIYWSISSIAFAGDAAVQAIITEREQNGPFYSLVEFKQRVSTKVNKRVITNLILSGCFDEIEKIKAPNDRLKLLNKHLPAKLPEDFTADNIWKEYFWILQQRALCGFGYIDYVKLSKSVLFKNKFDYISIADLEEDSSIGKNKYVMGIVSSVDVRNSRNGEFALIELNHNDIPGTCVMWAEIWPSFKEQLSSSVKKIVAITGEIKFDKHKKRNVLQTNNYTKVQIF
jgi:DNA polymerase-3 subunit alpha